MEKSTSLMLAEERPWPPAGLDDAPLFDAEDAKLAQDSSSKRHSMPIATPAWMPANGYPHAADYFEKMEAARSPVDTSDASSSRSSMASATSISEPDAASSSPKPFLPPAHSNKRFSSEPDVQRTGEGRYVVTIRLPAFDMVSVTWRKDGRMNVMADRWEKPGRDDDRPKGEHFERVIDFGIPAKAKKQAESVYQDNVLRISVEVQ